MKKVILLALMVIVGFQSQAVVDVNQNWKNSSEVSSAMTPEMSNMEMEEFLSMTPRKYRKMTGKRLGLKKSIQLKVAQKAIKKQMKRAGSDISSGVYILLAILGFGWIAIGLLDDWNGSTWIVNLLLYMLLWLPGFIHALIKKKDYF